MSTEITPEMLRRYSDDPDVGQYGRQAMDAAADRIEELEAERDHPKGRDCERTEEALNNYRDRAIAAETKLAAIPEPSNRELSTPRQKLAYVADLEAEVEDWRGAASRLLAAWPDDDQAFDRALGELAHLVTEDTP